MIMVKRGRMSRNGDRRAMPVYSICIGGRHVAFDDVVAHAP